MQFERLERGRKERSYRRREEKILREGIGQGKKGLEKETAQEDQGNYTRRIEPFLHSLTKGIARKGEIVIMDNDNATRIWEWKCSCERSSSDGSELQIWHTE